MTDCLLNLSLFVQLMVLASGCVISIIVRTAILIHNIGRAPHVVEMIGDFPVISGLCNLSVQSRGLKYSSIPIRVGYFHLLSCFIAGTIFRDPANPWYTEVVLILILKTISGFVTLVKRWLASYPKLLVLPSG